MWICERYCDESLLRDAVFLPAYAGSFFMETTKSETIKEKMGIPRIHVCNKWIHTDKCVMGIMLCGLYTCECGGNDSGKFCVLYVFRYCHVWVVSFYTLVSKYKDEYHYRTHGNLHTICICFVNFGIKLLDSKYISCFWYLAEILVRKTLLDADIGGIQLFHFIDDKFYIQKSTGRR